MFCTISDIVSTYIISVYNFKTFQVDKNTIRLPQWFIKAPVISFGQCKNSVSASTYQSPRRDNSDHSNRGFSSELPQRQTSTEADGDLQLMLLIDGSHSVCCYIWKCQTCKKFTNIRTGSVLCGKKLSFKSFLTMILYFSIRSLTNTEAVGELRTIIANAVADWFLRNCSPIGGPEKVVEVDLEQDQQSSSPDAPHSSPLPLTLLTAVLFP